MDQPPHANQDFSFKQLLTFIFLFDFCQAPRARTKLGVDLTFANKKYKNKKSKKPQLKNLFRLNTKMTIQ